MNEYYCFNFGNQNENNDQELNFDEYELKNENIFKNDLLIRVIKYGKCKKCKFGSKGTKRINYQYRSPKSLYYEEYDQNE